MESPGAYLKRERELRGITLLKIHEGTRVPLKYLEALEADDYDSLPHPTFTKGFIKTCCKYLGLDEVDAVLRYEMYLRERSEKPEKTPARAPTAGAQLFPSLSSRASGITGLAVAGLVIIIIFYLAYSRKGRLPAPPVAAEKPSEVTAKADGEASKDAEQAAAQEHEGGQTEKAPVKEGAASSAAQEGARIQKDNAAGGKKHSLTVQAVDTVWIKVKIDESAPFDVVLRKGEGVSWKAARQFALVVGNAGGVTLTFDGKRLKGLGKSGEVVHFKLPREEEEEPQSD